MAHAFDTQLAKPQRTVVREAVAQHLRDYSRLGYLVDVIEVGGIIKAGTEEEVGRIVSDAAGRSPLALVALGQKSYVAGDEGSFSDRYAASLEVLVYAYSKNLRDPLSRMKADVVALADDEADPGCEVMLEHFEEILIGYKPAPSWNDTVYQLVPTGESELDLGDDFALWRLSFSLRLARELDRARDGLVPMTSITARHQVDGAETQNPIATATTEIS